MELFLLYLWLKLDAIGFFFFLMFLGGCGGLIAALIWLMAGSGGDGWPRVQNPDHFQWAKENPDDGKRYHSHNPHPAWLDIPFLQNRLTQIALTLLIAGALVSTLLPTSKQTAVLVGGHFALKAIETPEAAKVMSLLRKKANEFLDEQLK